MAEATIDTGYRSDAARIRGDEYEVELSDQLTRSWQVQDKEGFMEVIGEMMRTCIDYNAHVTATGGSMPIGSTMRVVYDMLGHVRIIEQ